MWSAEPQGKLADLMFFHVSSVFTTHITLTDNGEAKWRALRDLLKHYAGWRLTCNGK